MHIFCTVSAKRIKCNCIYVADKPEKRFIFEIDGFKICVKTNCGLSIFFYWLIEKCTNGTNIESEKWGKSRICTEIFGHFSTGILHCNHQFAFEWNGKETFFIKIKFLIRFNSEVIEMKT